MSRIATRNGKPAWVDAPPRKLASRDDAPAIPHDLNDETSWLKRLLGANR